MVFTHKDNTIQACEMMDVNLVEIFRYLVCIAPTRQTTIPKWQQTKISRSFSSFLCTLQTSVQKQLHRVWEHSDCYTSIYTNFNDWMFTSVGINTKFSNHKKVGIMSMESRTIRQSILKISIYLYKSKGDWRIADWWTELKT